MSEESFFADWDDVVEPGSGIAAIPQPLRDASSPTPLSKVPAPPPFPVAALGGYLAEYVEHLAEATQTDRGLAGTVALGCLSAAAGGCAVVHVRDGWEEPINLFLAAVAQPGSRKSALMNQLSAPLIQAEQDLEKQNRTAVLEATTDRDVAERSAEALRKRAGSAKTSEERDNLTAEAVAAAETAESIQIPPKARLLADDVTPEMLASLLHEHGGRMAVLSSEGGFFETLAGRYSKTPNLDAALKGHAGDPLRVDRRGRPAEYVKRPALSLVLAIQPSVIDAIGRVEQFAGRGLLARFLFAMPPSNIGTRLVHPDPVPAAIRGRYTERLHALAMGMAGWSTDPMTIQLTPAAAAEHLAAHERLEPELQQHGALGASGTVVEWASKLMGATARIAGLLHLADHGPDGAVGVPLSVETMRRALQIGDYFTANAVAVFDRMGSDAEVDDAREVLRKLQTLGVTEISTRDLFSALSRSRFRRIAVLHSALTVLEQFGWVEAMPPEPRQGPGRPASPIVRVLADLTAEAAQTSEPLRFRLSAGSAHSAGYSAGATA